MRRQAASSMMMLMQLAWKETAPEFFLNISAAS